MSLNAGRWLSGGLASALTGTRLKDEQVVSAALGLLPTIGISLLAFVSLACLIMALRLHPPGSRLAPFVFAGLGGIAGLQVWFHCLGPRLFP